MTPALPARFVPLTLFAGLGLALALVAYLAHGRARDSVLTEKANELRAIGDLKTTQITAWRSERLADARVAAQDPLLVAAVREWLAGGARAERGASLQALLGLLRTERGYERVSLLDARGELRLSTPVGEPALAASDELAHEALATAEVSFFDLRRSAADAGIHLDLVAPLRAAGPPAARPVGFLVFQSDPRRFLYPLIQSLPTPSRSAETLLVRREGDEVVFLNELRHREGAALAVRRPMTESNLPAVLAVQGREGVVEGVDYRGQRVLAAIGSVRGTPWFLVSKIDYEEIVAPLAREAWLTALLAAALIALAGVGVKRILRRERDVADAELNEVESRYRAVFEGSLNGVAVYEILTDAGGRATDCRFLDVNRAFEDQTGLRREAVLGRRVTEVLPGIEKDPFIEIYGKVVASGEPARFDHVATALGRHYEVAAFPLGGTRFAAVFSDVTERKRAEERLRLQSAALAAAANAVLITDGEGRIVWVNQAFVRLTGWSLEECQGRTPRILKSGRHDQRFYEEVWRTILGGGVWQHDMLNRRKDGSVYTEEQTITPVTDAQGRITHFVAIKIDVTDRRMTEQALVESEARYRTLAEASQDDIFTMDAAGRILYVNARAAARFGREPGELRGRRLDELFPPDQCAALTASVQGVISTKRPVYGEREVRFPGGAVWLGTWLVPLEADEGAGAVMGVSRDITERRRLEEQLRRAQKMEAIGQLASEVAHDFNNLLSVIGGQSEMLLRGLPADHSQRKRVEEILRAGERAAGLTRRLLAFGRQQASSPIVLALRQVVSGLEGMLRRLIPDHIQVETILDSGAARVRADAGQLEQLILNLVVNARDAMPDGGRLILETSLAELDESYCRSHPSVRPGRYVLLAVSDTGTGMDAETQARIFEPFFTTKEAGRGTGLGLASVYGVVQQHAGHISFYSEPGRGTTFKVYVPQVDGVSGTSVLAPIPLRADKGNETVLLVEDAEELRELSLEVLQGLGYRVLEAPDGEAAIQASARHGDAIDLLLTDMFMPRMTGRQLAERLRASRPGLRVLLVSGYASEVVVASGKLEPGTAFLQKPFTPDQLGRKVREVLGT